MPERLDDLPISGRGFTRFFTGSVLLHLGAVIGFYFFITASIRVIEAYREQAAKNTQRKKDEALVTQQIDEDVKDIVRQRLEKPTEEQVEEVAEKIGEQLKKDEDLKEVVDDLVEKLDRPLPPRPEPSGSPPAEQPDDKAFEALAEIVDRNLQESVEDVSDDRLEQMLADRVFYEDVPEVQNQVDNAFKKEALDELARQSVQETSMEVTRNTYDEWNAVRAAQKPDKALWKIQQDIIRAQQKLNQAIARKDIKSAIDQGKFIPNLADATRKKLEGAPKAADKLKAKLPVHTAKKEQLMGLLRELEPLQAGFLDSKKDALREALKAHGIRSAIQAAADELKEKLQSGTSEQKQQRAQRFAQRLQKEVAEALEALDREEALAAAQGGAGEMEDGESLEELGPENEGGREGGGAGGEAEGEGGGQESSSAGSLGSLEQFEDAGGEGEGIGGEGGEGEGGSSEGGPAVAGVAGEGGGGNEDGEGEGEGEGGGGSSGGKGGYGGRSPKADSFVEMEKLKAEADELADKFPRTIEAIAITAGVVTSFKNGPDNSRVPGPGGAGDADTDTSIHLRFKNRERQAARITNSRKMGVTESTLREIIQRNAGLLIPDQPPPLAAARPTAFSIRKEERPKPSAELYIDSSIPKREIRKENPNRSRLRHPNYPKGSYAAIPYMRRRPVIDGKDGDWNLSTTHLGKLLDGRDRSLHMGWRPEGLFVLAKVKDLIPGWKKGDDIDSWFWVYDCIEFWFDMKNSKAENTRKQDCQQFYVWPALKGLHKTPILREIIWKADKDFWGKQAWHNTDTIMSRDDGQKKWIASTEHAGAYTLEIFFPRTLLRNLGYFKAGQVLGFHYVINHGVAKGQESDPNLIEPFVQPYSMKFHYSSHPNSWGNLQLLGTDGNLNILRPDGKPSDLPIAEVSKVLGLQVIDPDSNTDTAIRNHMTLRVRNRVGFNGDATSPDGRLLGDWEDLRLTETGRSTGIFEGWLKLTVLPSINGDGRLSARSGDLLDISYNDFIKTAGEYNQKLAATVHVVAPVFSVDGGRKE